MKQIRLQMNLMFKSLEFQIALFIMTLFSIGSFFDSVYESAGQSYNRLFDAECYICSVSGYSGILWQVLLPVVPVLVFATSYIKEKKNSNLTLMIQRGTCRDYFLSKILVNGFGIIIVMGLPIILNYALCCIYFPHNEYSFNWASRIYRDDLLAGRNLLYETDRPAMLFANLYCRNPWIYQVVLFLLFLLFALAIGSFALCLSFRFPQSRLLLFVPSLLMTRGLLYVDAYAYTRAMENPGYIYRDYNLIEYLEPFPAMAGMHLEYLLLFFVAILGFCIISFKWAVHRQEQILIGGMV